MRQMRDVRTGTAGSNTELMAMRSGADSPFSESYRPLFGASSASTQRKPALTFRLLGLLA